MTTASGLKMRPTLKKYLEEGKPFQVAASFDEYLEFAEKCAFKVEYSHGNLVFMGSPTDKHELICGNLIWSLNELFELNEECRVYGSNLSILIQASGQHYKPDVTVIAANPEFVSHTLKKQTIKSIINPFLVAEVFSDGTMDYDYTEKLPNYKLCPSLDYILLVHQHKPFVTLYQREKDFWVSQEFTQIDQTIHIADGALSLSKIYQKMNFLGLPPGDTK